MSSDRAKAYTQAGVDIEAGNALVSRIKGMVQSTQTRGVISDIGGFGGLFRPDLNGMTEPVLVSSTDGVGTKLKVAFACNKHDTVGIDLVAMSVNDILVQGANPLFFLDYFATGKLDVETAQTVIGGVAEGCRQASCALLGGETAEMPDMYAPGEYDLAGFCVGIVDNAKLIDGSGIQVGDKIIGIASSGLHSNGYSLVRKILARDVGQADDDGNLALREVELGEALIVVAGGGHAQGFGDRRRGHAEVGRAREVGPHDKFGAHQAGGADDVADPRQGAQFALDDARVQLHLGDGMAFVDATQERFDLVLMDLTDPDTPASALYSDAADRKSVV